MNEPWLDTDPEDDKALEGFEQLAAVVILASIVFVALIAGVIYACRQGLS